MALMGLLFNLFKILTVYLLIFTNNSVSENSKCISDEDYMCFYNTAFEITKKSKLSREHVLSDEENDLVLNYFTKFLDIIQKNNYEVSKELLIYAYSEVGKNPLT